MSHFTSYHFRNFWTAAGLLLFASSATFAEEPGLKIVAGDDPTRVEVIARRAGDNLPAEVLQFALVTDSDKAGPALFGQYRSENGQLIFRPRHRLVPGFTYVAVLQLGDGKSVRRTYRVPKPESVKKTVVDRIYPSADLLPANQLKFYIHFSQPMRESKTIFDHFQLLDDKGNRVYDPWRRTELWNDDATRLTLWIHPGRVKRGVNLREDFGPVLEPGRRYRLVIDAELRDAHGSPLARSFEKSFRTTDPDRERPVLSGWKLTPPTADTREPLTIDFGEPLDQPLLFRFLKVVDAKGAPVNGKIEVGEQESIWRFTPEANWSGDEYRVVVSELLEDLAGNTPTRLFDADVATGQAEPAQRELKYRPKNR